jgi:hypothetical protein
MKPCNFVKNIIISGLATIFLTSGFLIPLTLQAQALEEIVVTRPAPGTIHSGGAYLPGGL